MNEQWTNNERTKDEQWTNKWRTKDGASRTGKWTNDEQMMKERWGYDNCKKVFLSYYDVSEIKLLVILKYW